MPGYGSVATSIDRIRSQARTRKVVEKLNAIFENEPFERRFRDAYSVSQHLQGRLAHFEQIGKHLLGQETDLMFV